MSRIFDLQDVQRRQLGHHLRQESRLCGGAEDVRHALRVVLDLLLPSKNHVFDPFSTPFSPIFDPFWTSFEAFRGVSSLLLRHQGDRPLIKAHETAAVTLAKPQTARAMKIVLGTHIHMGIDLYKGYIMAI